MAGMVGPEFLAQLVERRNHTYEDRRAELGRRQELLQVAHAAGREHLSTVDQREYQERSRTVARLDRDLEALDKRLRHVRSEIERSGENNPLVQRLRGQVAGGPPQRDPNPLGFSTEQLRGAHQRLMEGGTFKLQSRAFSSVEMYLPPMVFPQVIGPVYENRLLYRLLTSPTDAPSVEYLQHLTTTGTPAVVAEGQPKPELVFVTNKVVLPMQKIAANTASSYESLQDFDSWFDYVSTTLFSQVINTENDALLNGGTTGDTSGFTSGFFGTSGILSHAVGETETPLDAVESSIAALRVGPALATANLIVLNPNTWSALRKQKDQYGRYLTTPDPTSDTAQSLWGVSVLQTTQLAAGAGLVLDTQKFGRVWMREGLSMRTGYSGADFTNNILRFVCEERLGLAIERPAAVLSITGLPTS